MNKYSVVKADKDLFAVYQTVYSNADTELSYDWHLRLNDTTWTEECYWVVKGEQKLGGIIILEEEVWFAFLILPFNDRDFFWQIIHNHIRMNNLKIKRMCSVFDCDIGILLSFGYKIGRSRKCMCRPTDIFPLTLDNRYYYRIPDIKIDLDEMVFVYNEGYKGFIDYDFSDIKTTDEIKNDIINFYETYTKTNSVNQSVLVYEKETKKIVGMCLAGKYPEAPARTSWIAEITVLPEHRNRGIAEFMVKNAITEAHKTSQIMLLCVTVGNNAERTYRKIGFFSGPRFTTMSLR